MRARSGRSSRAKDPTSWPSTCGTNGSRSPGWIPTCRPRSSPPDRRSPKAPGPGGGHPRVRPTASQETARAISRPSAGRRLPGRRPPCSADPRRSRARSLTATPAPATTSAGSPTARAARVPQKITPAMLLGDQFEAYHNSTTYYAFQRRGTLAVIDDAGTVYRTPQKMQIYAYNVAGQDALRRRLLRGRSSIDLAHWATRRRILGPDSVRRRIHPEGFFGRDAVAVSGRVTDAIYLRRTTAREFQVDMSTPHDVARLCASVLQAELDPLDHWMAAVHSA